MRAFAFATVSALSLCNLVSVCTAVGMPECRLIAGAVYYKPLQMSLNKQSPQAALVEHALAGPLYTLQFLLILIAIFACSASRLLIKACLGFFKGPTVYRTKWP
jgi:hypothetical protein